MEETFGKVLAVLIPFTVLGSIFLWFGWQNRLARKLEERRKQGYNQGIRTCVIYLRKCAEEDAVPQNVWRLIDELSRFREE